MICRARSASSTVRRSACVIARRTQRIALASVVAREGVVGERQLGQRKRRILFQRANPGRASFFGTIGGPRLEAFGVGGERFDGRAAHFAQQAR